MRNIMAGFVVLGTLALGTMAPASAHPLRFHNLSCSHMPFSRPIGMGYCGPRCQEHHREARERERQPQRWADIGGGRNIVAGRIAATVRHRLMIINTVTEIRDNAHQARCGEGVAQSHDRALMLRFDCFHREP